MLEGDILLNQDTPTPSPQDSLGMLNNVVGELAMLRQGIDWIRQGEEGDEQLDSMHDDVVGCLIRADRVRRALYYRYFAPVQQSTSERGEMDIMGSS